jgi:putative flippase GtrA
MKKIHHQVRSGILGIVDFFYPLFKRFMPLQTYRYAACGGGNTLLNIFIFFFAHNFIFQKNVLHLGPVAISSHIAAFLLAFCFTFPVGFYMSMYVVFQGSYLRRRIQFMRYFLVAVACIFFNYILLKVFVDLMGWYPTPSLILTTCFVVVFSYLAQRFFSFKVERKEIMLEPQCSMAATAPRQKSA